MIKERIKKLQDLMNLAGCDLYYIPTGDYHSSEYISDYFKERKYMSGFTGSAGYMLVSKSKAYLWTDGRYFIQAERELEGTGIELMRMGQTGVPTIEELIKASIAETIGMDAKTVSIDFAKNLSDQGYKIKSLDLVDEIWKDRPSLPKDPIFELDVKYAGVTRADKLKNLIEGLGDRVHIISALDEIAWLLNLRGKDVLCTPLFLSYMIVLKDSVSLFIDQDKLSDEIKTNLEKDHINIYDYDLFYEEVSKLNHKKVTLDFDKNNYECFISLNETNKVFNEVSSIDLAKAKKNEVEIENIKKAHVKDGVAMVNFLYWLKDAVKSGKESEWTATLYLNEQRKQQGAIDLSFTPIVGYNANAAMMHYSATSDKYSDLKPEGVLLIDSGGQYLEGTTDITRTVALGETSDYVKTCFTTVLKSVLDLWHAKFLYGCTGMNLDILARNPIWQMDIDYQCGTGHGVGYLSTVHEGPQGFRWKKSPTRKENSVLEEGMVITDEPGVYLEGQFGIRTEQELVVRKGVNNFYGQFMEFECVTYCLIDLSLIKKELLNDTQIKQLNEYHKMVFEILSPYFEGDKLSWLKESCREI